MKHSPEANRLFMSAMWDWRLIDTARSHADARGSNTVEAEDVNMAQAFIAAGYDDFDNLDEINWNDPPVAWCMDAKQALGQFAIWLLDRDAAASVIAVRNLATQFCIARTRARHERDAGWVGAEDVNMAIETLELNTPGWVVR